MPADLKALDHTPTTSAGNSQWSIFPHTTPPQPPPWPLFRLQAAVERHLPLVVARLQPPTATAYAVGMGFAHSKALYAGERRSQAGW